MTITLERICRRGNLPLRILITVFVVLAVSFICIPLAALLLRVPPEFLLASLQDPVVMDALFLSFITASISTGIVICFGTPVAYINARCQYPGKKIIDTITDLPVVLPPAVAGLALLMAFGRRGFIGQYLNLAGIDIAFTTIAVIMAQVFVASPFYIRQARTSFAGVNRVYEHAARTLGASPLTTFFSITVPLAMTGILSGAVMTFARALGEFGATIMFAGNLQGKTQTMPLAIYGAMQGSMEVSLVLAVMLVIISFAVIIAVKILTEKEEAGS
ncbi:ABC transporter permease [uncultured Methanoregula sp.]|uniref:ABC transporter permease n=1 Tax=uncultured Methanoregula sp. TaxID=1005933 RepID=UPI002AAAD526|nr:ABC transporter permease [uncultured Methanoregula sp.]